MPQGELTARGVKISHNAIWLFLRREGNLGSHNSAALPPYDQGRRRKALVLAALFTRSQSHRASLRNDEKLDACRPKAHHRGRLATSRQPRRSIEARECSNYFANAGYASVKT
jgi:hypothetical protein